MARSKPASPGKTGGHISGKARIAVNGSKASLDWARSNRRLMSNEKPCGEGKSRRGMFGVQSRAEGGSQVADDGLCDSEQAKRNGGAAETVLHEADRRAQQESRRRVSAAEAEINHHKQWQIEQSGPRKMQREPGLNHQREQRGNGNRAGAE